MKPHGCARRLGACLIFGCACVTHASRGYADWETVPDVRLVAETNDNPSLNVVGATQLVVTELATNVISPGFASWMPDTRTISMSPSPSRRHPRRSASSRSFTL